MAGSSSFRVAFFSDPHLGPLPTVPWRALLGKRLTGFLNWRLKRRSAHSMEALAAIVADMLAAAPDHIICGGDLINIGLAEEFVAAQRFLERLGNPGRVSLTPGNHCAYMKDSIAPLLSALGPWMTGDGEAQPAFPYLRRRGPIALIGLNSAIPSPPFDATGALGETQIESAFLLLTALRAQDLCRIIVVHHFPHVGGAPRDRRLRDAPGFEAMLARAGAELVLHGHNHATSIAHRAVPRGATPIVGVASASERNIPRGRAPAWLSIDVRRRDAGGWSIEASERSLGAGGAMIARPLDLSPVSSPSPA